MFIQKDSMFDITYRKSSTSMGLMMWQFAWFLYDFTTSFSELEVVSMITGICCNASEFLIKCQTSWPFFLGRLISNKIQSGVSASKNLPFLSKNCMPSLPSLATVIVHDK